MTKSGIRGLEMSIPLNKMKFRAAKTKPIFGSESSDREKPTYCWPASFLVRGRWLATEPCWRSAVRRQKRSGSCWSQEHGRKREGNRSSITDLTSITGSNLTTLSREVLLAAY